MSFIYEYIPQGDVEAAIISILRDADEVINFSGGAPEVSSDLVGYQMKDSAKRRWIMVTREGGNIRWPNIDKPRVDIQVLAESRSVAHNLAQVAQAVIFRAMGQAFPEYGTVITDVRVETGITRVPDRETGANRYIFALRLVCKPT
jgi:hypothetical protein